MEKNPFTGQLDRKIVIKEITTINNPIGENVETETIFCEPYAMLTELSGSEALDGKVIHLVDRKYTIRYRKEIAQRGNQMILIDGSDKFKIIHSKLIGRRSHLELICSRSE
jgi:head-tail adaptor